MNLFDILILFFLGNPKSCTEFRTNSSRDFNSTARGPSGCWASGHSKEASESWRTFWRSKNTSNVFEEKAGAPPLQCSHLENPTDGGAWWAAVHGVAKGRTRLSDFTFAFHLRALEKAMAAHPSVLAWRVPGTGNPVAAVYGVAQSRTRLSDFTAAAATSLKTTFPAEQRHRFQEHWRFLVFLAASAVYLESETTVARGRLPRSLALSLLGRRDLTWVWKIISRESSFSPGNRRGCPSTA